MEETTAETIMDWIIEYITNIFTAISIGEGVFITFLENLGLDPTQFLFWALVVVLIILSVISKVKVLKYAVYLFFGLLVLVIILGGMK